MSNWPVSLRYNYNVCIRQKKVAIINENQARSALLTQLAESMKRHGVRPSQCGPTAANPPHAAAAIDKWDMETDGRTDGHRAVT